MGAQELESRLILHRSNRPGDDVKDWTRPHNHTASWKAWGRTKQEIVALCCHGPPLQFMQEDVATDYVLQIARRDVQLVRLQYRRPRDGDHKDYRAVGRRRRGTSRAKDLA